MNIEVMDDNAGFVVNSRTRKGLSLKMNDSLKEAVRSALLDFIEWLDRYGEISWDHQSYFAGPWGGRAKAFYYRRPRLGTIAVMPMILSEAFIPDARCLFWKRQRLPIADAHYAMGFALLYQLTGDTSHCSRAVHFLKVLQDTRCPGYERYCWGYPFDWETRTGTIPAGTPLITTTPYAYEAFELVHYIDGDTRWQGIMRSIADHAAQDIRDRELSPGVTTCSYTPQDEGGVVNASAYRAGLLARAAATFQEPALLKVAEGNIRFVLSVQKSDGSWPYSIDTIRDFVDHFHTCFVLKGLFRFERLTGDTDCRRAIERGVEYYVKNLFDADGLPKPFSRAPRMTVYRNELYDYAECLNICLLLQDRFSELAEVRDRVVKDLIQRWRKTDGSFRSRRLYLGWDNVPMHRWAQSQIFRALALMLCSEAGLRSLPALDGATI